MQFARLCVVFAANCERHAFKMRLREMHYQRFLFVPQHCGEFLFVLKGFCFFLSYTFPINHISTKSCLKRIFGVKKHFAHYSVQVLIVTKKTTTLLFARFIKK